MFKRQQRVLQGVWAVLFGLVALAISVQGTMAQDGNLLTNPGMEEAGFGIYVGQGRGDLNLPVGWGIWVADGPRDADKPWQNRADKTFAFPHRGPDPNPHQGVMALNVSAGYNTSTNAVYQQVTVPADTAIQASAWVWIHTCTLPKDSKGNPTSETCGSSPASEAFVKVGIDPNGGSDPFAPEIVWSPLAAPHDQWLQVSSTATTSGTTATIFLYSTQKWAADLNNVYWDETYLGVGGTGGSAPGAATAAPTAPPVVAFVVPQATQENGGIVHKVQPGDTIDSIAYAYGVTRTQILELNNIADPRFISIGQELIVSLPPDAASNQETTTAPEATAEVPSESAAEPTNAPPIVQVEPTETAPDAAAVQPTMAPPVALNEPPQTPAPAPVVAAVSGQVDPAAQTGSVCVLVFDDKNQNRMQEPDEALLASSTVALSTSDQAVGSYETDGVSEPYCFTGLAAGNYNAVAGAPAGYGLTTPDQFRVQLLPGATVVIAFGAAEGVQPLLPPPPDAGGLVTQNVSQTSEQPLSATDQLLQYSGLIIFGFAGVVLIGGIGLTLLLRRR
ncbi:MAG: LysM peptidoglycan-binding domain-containing protein [Anaerolineaceae bacterium]|nr:LysM peptidoglycan-binding domain-containing protein [Anaerolineaceae bacterium]